MKKQIIYSSIVSMMILAACGGNPQNQGQQAGLDDSTQTAVAPNPETLQDEAPQSSQITQCEHYSALALLLKGCNPILCDSNEYIDKCAKSFGYMLYENELIPIKYKEYQTGEDLLGSLIFRSDCFDEFTGHVYTLSKKVNEDYGTVELFTKDYCDSHHLAKINFSKKPSLPESLKSHIADKYPSLKLQKVLASADIDNGKAHYYSMQFRQVADSNLAINVLEQDGQFYINEVWGHYGEWNVDDEGEYNFPYPTIMAANDGSHFEIFYTTGAAESTSYGELVIEGDRLIDKNIHGYYNYIDYSSRRNPDYYSINYQWNNFFHTQDEAPEEYANIKVGNFYRLFLKKGETILYCKFERGSITPVCTNIDTVSEALGYIEVYEKGAISGAGVAAHAVTTVSVEDRWHFDHYSEILGGQYAEYSKIVDGKESKSTEQELEEAKTRLGKVLEINVNNLEWKKHEEPSYD